MKPICRLSQIALVFHVFGWSAQANDLFLSDSLVRKGQLQDVLEHQPAKVPSCKNAPPTGPIETTTCDYETVESVNDDLFGNLSHLVRMPFFRFFQVDLYRECPFWPDHGSCSDPGCAITTVDESDVPEKWRAETLSKVDPSSRDTLHQLPGCYYRDSDFCFLDDNTEGDYFDLQLVPERYTGYSGPDPHRVWRSIYEENCFGLSELSLMTGKLPAPVSLPDTMIESLHENGEGSDPHCLEKRVYYKVISGLHASISTHICHEYLNQKTGEWGPNLACFIDKVVSHPERLQYIYFNTILMLRAVARLGPYLSAYDYCSSGKRDDDAETLATLSKVIAIAKIAGKFDEKVLFRGENANVLKEEFKTHFRNVTRIMDCVGCDKCRLWGKVQTTGVATALKILFELDEQALDPHANSNLLHRSEVVAMINTLFRFSESLKFYDDFRRMWQTTGSSNSEKRPLDVGETLPHTIPSPSANEDNLNPFDQGMFRFASFLRICKSNTVDCLALFLKAFQTWLGKLASAFRPSGKENGPSGALYGEL